MRCADIAPVLSTALMPGGSRRVKITFKQIIQPQCFNYLLKVSTPMSFDQSPFVINLSSIDRTILVEANKTGIWPKKWPELLSPLQFQIPIVDHQYLDINKFVDEMGEFIEKIEILPHA